MSAASSAEALNHRKSRTGPEAAAMEAVTR